MLGYSATQICGLSSAYLVNQPFTSIDNMKSAIASLSILWSSVVLTAAPNHRWPLDSNLQDAQGLNHGAAVSQGAFVPAPVGAGFTRQVRVVPWTDMQTDWAVSLWFKWIPTSVEGDQWSTVFTVPNQTGVAIAIPEQAVVNAAPELAGEIGNLILVIAGKQWLIPDGWTLRKDRWYHVSLSAQGTTFDLRLRDTYGTERSAVLAANELPNPVTTQTYIGFGDDEGNVIVDDARGWTTNAKAEADAAFLLV